jgi:hypothetical protein
VSNTLIPLQFVQRKSSLNWGECLWAYKRELLTWKDLIQVALERVENGSSNELEIELASVNKDSVWKVSELAQALAEQGGNSEEASTQKWLFLCLAWAYENSESIPDPLGAVETIYADFDYPSAIESFVRFLPPSDGYMPAQFSQEQNHQRLMQKWREFLLQNS